MEENAAALRAMHICRFCLTEKDPLSNIYEKDSCKNAIPLPLQIMACVTIEVFANDGMPQLICDECRLQFRKSYSFKTICKRSDDALKSYLTTGELSKDVKDDISKLLLKTSSKRPLKQEEESVVEETTPKRIKTSDSSVQVNIPTEKPVQTKIKPSPTITTPIIETDIPSQSAFISDDFEIKAVAEYNEPFIDESDLITTPNKIKSSKQFISECFPCNHCERSFPLKQMLDIHMRQHNRERNFECDECGKKFFTKHDLTKHLLTHTGEKPFSCVACNKTFSRATLLHRHEKTHITVPKYLCTHCDKTYLTAEDLDVHVETHKKKRPFKCKSCDKSFAFKQGLERHEMTHTSENKHKCNYCEESFTTPGKLARHIQTHAGARPYPCKLCHRTFLLSHHLTRHLRLHYRNKNKENECGQHKCDYCSMSFRRKDSLIHHTAIHSMVNLKCVICNKEFDDVTYVKEHVNTHLSGLEYPCDKCDYSFETQDELDEHERRHIAQQNSAEEDEYVTEYLDEQHLEDESNQTEENINNDDDDDEEDDFLSRLQAVQDTASQPVRRSQREKKVKNYADFLKDESSDEEQQTVAPKEEPESPKVQIGAIPPVIRSETIKMYKGVKEKSTPNKIIPIAKQPEPILPGAPTPIEASSSENAITSSKQVTKLKDLESLGLSKETLDVIAQNPGIVEMKVGQKIVRVKKLMMTKAEYQAMAKKGKLELKGSKIVIPNISKEMDLQKLVRIQDPLQESTIEIQPAIDLQVSKNPIRTYVKKIPKKDEPHVENIFADNIISETVVSDQTIDLDDTVNENDTSIKEAEILNNFE